MQADRMTAEAVDEHLELMSQFRAYDSDGTWTDLEREAFGRAMTDQRSRLILMDFGNRWSVRFGRRGAPTTARQIREFKADLSDVLRLVGEPDVADDPTDLIGLLAA